MKVRKILVSQPAPAGGDSPFRQLEERFNVKVTFRPFIKTERVTVKEFRAEKIDISEFNAVCFTTVNCVDYFFQIAQEMRVPITDDWKYFCISETVANYLQKFINYRKRKVFFPLTGTMGELMEIISKHTDLKMIVARPESGNEPIVAEFDKLEMKYALAVLCRTVFNEFTPEETFEYDMILLFSPHGVAAMKKYFPDWEQGERIIGCYGKLTAQAIRDAGYRLDLETPTEQYPSLHKAVFDFIKENHKRRS